MPERRDSKRGTMAQMRGSDQDKRTTRPIVVDLERLEAHAEDLYLTRFVEAVKKARCEFGRYLQLRTGDELAIRAAGDGSADLLDNVAVEDEERS